MPENTDKFHSRKQKGKKILQTNRWQGKRERSGGIAVASPSAANRCPKKEAKEGIEASPLAHTARFCKCSCFNIALTLEDPSFVCFLPLASSLSETGFWNLDGVFAALFMPPPLFPMLSFLSSLLSFSEKFRRTVNTEDFGSSFFSFLFFPSNPGRFQD